MTNAEIKVVQKTIGTTADGFWGQKSDIACKRYIRSLMPTPHPFPTKSEITAFFGRHGVKGGYTPPTKRITLPFTVYYEGSPVKTLNPHVKCADRFLAAFHRLAEAFPTEASRRAAGILTYDGLYNPRKMRGGSSMSMHAWAIAIDLDANRNGNTVHWPTGACMPLLVMECFAREGIAPAGALWSRDAMHMEAVNPG